MLVNLTPHPVVFENGTTLPKCDEPPRLTETSRQIGTVNGVPLFRKLFDIEGCELPPNDGVTTYVVSLLIAQAFRSLRNDLVVTNDPIRDDQGRIVGCRSLAKV